MGHTFCQSQSRRVIRKGKLAHLNNLHVIFFLPIYWWLTRFPSQLPQLLYGPKQQRNFVCFFERKSKIPVLGFLRLENSNVAHAVKSIRPFDVKVTRGIENPFAGHHTVCSRSCVWVCCAHLFQFFRSAWIRLTTADSDAARRKLNCFTLKFSMQNTNISYVNRRISILVSWLHVSWFLHAVSNEQLSTRAYVCLYAEPPNPPVYANASIGMTECDTCNDVRFCANEHIIISIYSSVRCHMLKWR